MLVKSLRGIYFVAAQLYNCIELLEPVVLAGTTAQCCVTQFVSVL